MSGPWYEESGPDYKYVRNDFSKRYKNKYKNNACVTEDDITRIVEGNIPEDISLGSWRGYVAFGIDNIKKECMEKAIQQRILEIENAIGVLKDKFAPYILHWLYKPEGMRVKQHKVSFENQQNIISSS